MEKLLFIVNPHAGKGRILPYISDIIEIFAQANFLTTVYFTKCKDDATRITMEVGEGFDRIICSGGDGTLSEVLSGLMKMKVRPVLGFIPTGTTNDSANSLQIPKGDKLAAVTASFGAPMPFDVGLFNGTPFAYIAAFGAFTEVSYDTPQELKSKFGHFAYVIAGISSIGSIRPYHMKVEYDGGIIEDDFIYGMICNSTSIGGFALYNENDISLNDGKHEVMLVRELQTPLDVQKLITGLLSQGTTSSKIAVKFSTSKLKITSMDDIPWTLDGEFGGRFRHVDFENVQGAVRISHRLTSPQ